MRCGAKCFLVEFEIEGKKHVKSVNARTPAGARKTIRSVYGADIIIKSAQKKERYLFK